MNRSLSNVTKQCDAEALKERGWCPRSPEVVVSVEWPAFDDALLPALPDDAAGIQSGGDDGAPAHVFEALTAPLWLGEAARRLMVRLGDVGGWFLDSSAGGQQEGDEEGGRGEAHAPPLWREPGSLDAVAVARVAADCSADARFAAEELAAAFVPEGDCRSRRRFLRLLEGNREARVQCRDACSALLRRSARLTAAGVAGVLIHREETSSGGASSSTAPSSPLPDYPLSPSLCPPRQKRTIVAVEGAMLRRGGLFADELRRALAETLEAASLGPSSFSSSYSPSSSPSLPLVSLTSPDGGSALGVAALAAAADNAARAMGQQDLGQSTTDGKFLHFPPRASN
jgi:hypothetical protein